MIMNLLQLLTVVCINTLCYCQELNNIMGKKDINICRPKRESTEDNQDIVDNDNIKLRLDLGSIIIPKITQQLTNMEESENCLIRHKRGVQSVLNTLNNNDKIKLHLDLKNILPQITLQPPNVARQPITNYKSKTRPKLNVQGQPITNYSPRTRPNIQGQPITNYRPRSRPNVLARNRIISMNRGASQTSYRPVNNNVRPPIKRILLQPKCDATNPVGSASTNARKSEMDKEDFYLESDVQNKKSTDTEIKTVLAPVGTSTKETALKKLKEETSGGENDKNDVIIGIMHEIPNIIKSVLNERMKAESNPIVIKNITEINFPIQRGDTVKTESQAKQKSEKINAEKAKQHNKEVMDLLLKTIKEVKQNDSNVLADTKKEIKSEVNSSPQDVVVSKEEVGTIEFKQNKISEIVEQNQEPPSKDEENQPNSESSTLYINSSLMPTSYQNVYNLATPYTNPLQASTPVYNPTSLYTTAIDVYPNVSIPDAMYISYQYPIPPNFNLASALCQPKVNEIKSNGYNDKNTKWRTWTNTEVVIKSNNNVANWEYQKLVPTIQDPRNVNGYNNVCYQNGQSVYGANSYYGYPNIGAVY